MIELILGGARSGKSTLAEQHAHNSGLAVSYIATANCLQSQGDPEMARRIVHHAARRPAHWRLVESPLYLAQTLQENASAESCLIVDCLTLWLSNLLFQGQAAQQAEAGLPIDCPLLFSEMQTLLDILPGLPGHIILVNNEVGMGIVPLGAINRLYVDEAGRLNQRIAAMADRVLFVAAGLPLILKDSQS